MQAWCGRALWHLPNVGTRTGSPMTWLSTCRVRLMPTMPKTTKTMAPVSTSGRTAGFPQPVFTQGLKPKVAEGRALGAVEGVTAVWEGGAQPPKAPPRPPRVYLSRWARRRSLWSAHRGWSRAGSQEGPHTHARGKGACGTGQSTVSCGGKGGEARTEARKARSSGGGEAQAAVRRGWKSAGDGLGLPQHRDLILGSALGFGHLF